MRPNAPNDLGLLVPGLLKQKANSFSLGKPEQLVWVVVQQQFGLGLRFVLSSGDAILNSWASRPRFVLQLSPKGSNIAAQANGLGDGSKQSIILFHHQALKRNVPPGGRNNRARLFRPYRARGPFRDLRRSPGRVAQATGVTRFPGIGKNCNMGVARPALPGAKKTPGVFSAQHPSGPSGKRHLESFSPSQQHAGKKGTCYFFASLRAEFAGHP